MPTTQTEIQKTFFTFDKAATIFNGKLRPENVILVVEGEDVRAGITKVRDSFIGKSYLTAFGYREIYDNELRRTGFTVYSLDQLKDIVKPLQTVI